MAGSLCRSEGKHRLEGLYHQHFPLTLALSPLGGEGIKMKLSGAHDGANIRNLQGGPWGGLRPR
jgi:hypothetical protein